MNYQTHERTGADVMTISRRALVSAMGCAASPFSLLSFTAASKAQRQAPGIFRHMVGQFEVTALLDGELTLAPELFPDADRDWMARLAEQAFQRLPVLSPTNAYAVNTGNRLYLIDTGAGSLLGPSHGHLAENLTVAGITPEQVDAILITHMHPDHIGG
jgi:hypothetical protein